MKIKIVVLLILTALSFALPLNNQPTRFTLTQRGGDFRVIEFSTGSLNWESLDGGTRISAVQAGSSGIPGSADIPLYSVFLSAETGRSYEFSYEVTRSHTVPDFQPVPVPEYFIHDAVHEDLSKSTAAGSDLPVTFPDEIIMVSDPMIMRDQVMVQLTVQPFIYNHETSVLTVIDDMEIHLTAFGTKSSRLTENRPPSRAFEPFYQSMMLDYETDLRDNEYQQPAVLYICGGSAEIHPEMINLMEWKHETGFEIYSVTANNIGSTAESISDYIYEAYTYFDPAPEYVVLVGDVGGTYDIPTFYESWSDCGGGSCYGEGDHPYTQLEGNDILPEILIGRISIQNLQDLSVIVNKIINYEQGNNPGIMWYERAALAANPDAYGGGQSLVTANEYIQELMQTYGMTDTRLGIDFYDVGISTWINSQLNQGVSYLNFRGLYGPASYNIDVITEDLNSHSMSPVITFITCGTGSFAYETATATEVLLRSGVSPSNYSGAVAVIGTSTWGTHTPFNNMMDMGIYHGIFAEGVPDIGSALQCGKLALLNTYPNNPNHYVDIFTHWNNLMGDPTLRLWTDTPNQLTVNLPAEIGLGTGAVSVEVIDSDDQLVEDAFVTLLSEDGVLFKSALTNAAGQAEIPLDDYNSGEVLVTVTARNCIPWQGSLQISGLYVLDLSGSAVITETGGHNSDGLANPGETLLLEIPMQNTGLQTIQSLTAVLSAPSDLVLIHTPQVAVESLTAGDSFTAGFEIEIDPGFETGTASDLVLQVTDGDERTWETLIPLEIHAGLTEFAYAADADGLPLLPGYSGEVIIHLDNNGLISLTNLSAELSYEGLLDVDIDDSSGFWPQIAAGGSEPCTDSFSISFDPNIIPGSVIPFRLHLFGTAYETEKILLITLGETTVDEPLGPDEYGYYIYDSGDTGYSLAPEYMYQSVSPEYGGMGTPMNMTDCGEGVLYEQGPVHIALPFEFTFYGVDYDTISVSSNGWIAFGTTNMESFRNTGVPGPGGPAPMAALFWDDLRTVDCNDFYNADYLGDVYVDLYQSPDFIVVEWEGLITNYGEDPVSFQAILFNTDDLTPTGDDEIMVHYKYFSNTSAGLYLPAYQGMVHGAYATIGLENEWQTQGLQYTFNNSYPTAARELTDQSAIFITTRQPRNLMDISTAVGEPPLAIQFTENSGYTAETWSWDIGMDGLIESSDPSFEYVFEDYGHYPVQLTITTADTEYTDIRLYAVHTVPYGCTDPLAYNYDADAVYDDGSCDYIYGCMDPGALNYDEEAVMDDESCVYLEFLEIPNNIPDSQSSFGKSVDMDGNWAIVGCYRADVAGEQEQGLAKIFMKIHQNAWVEMQELVADDGETFDYFGYSVAMDGEYAVIGAYRDDDGGSSSGSAYVYHQNQVTSDWEFHSKLNASDAGSSDNFGYSVEIQGDLIAVGSRKADSSQDENTGAVYLYELTGGEWTETTKLTAAGSERNDSFGAALEFSGSRIIIGANLHDGPSGSNSGAAYVFAFDGAEWIEEAALIPLDVDEHSHFGVAVAIHEDRALAGAMYDNNDNGSNAGCVYVYDFIDGTWQNTEEIIGFEDTPADLFGQSLTVNSDFAVIGASEHLYIYYFGDNAGWSASAGFQTEVTTSVTLTGSYLIAGDPVAETASVYEMEDMVEWLDIQTDMGTLIPVKSGLSINYPNPFNPVTIIPFELAEPGAVSIQVYDLMGHRVATLLDEYRSPGYYQVQWDGHAAASGIYFIRMTAAGQRHTRKVMLVK